MKDYDQALQYEIMTHKEYRFADAYISAAKIIFDIGGHKGYFTEYCLSINPEAEIHIFEPIRENIEVLAHTYESKEDIYINPFGISTHTGKQTLFVHEEKSMQTSAYKKTFLNPKGKAVEVEMKRLDEYIDEFFIEEVDLLKMDIEGMEFDVLLDLDEKYFDMIHTLVIEYHLFDAHFQKKYDQLQSKLKKLYPKVELLPNSYSEKLGYIFCTR